MTPPRYRLYVDEVGNPDLKASADPRHKYLSLTGVILDLNYVADVVAPQFERIKRAYFGSHPDNPVVLHRKEMVNYRPPFGNLVDQGVRAAFNEDLLRLLDDLAFIVITAVIDKEAHLARYGEWSSEPYHYCLTALVERYVMFLSGMYASGDVLAEARGKREDRALKEAFAEIYEHGTMWLAAGKVQAKLTSRELKVKPKEANIPGLQLADMLAHPSWRATICRRHDTELDDSFGGRVAALLEATKYRRSSRGQIWGYGRVWLPLAGQE